ncbi:Aspartate aminotransferase [Raoultella planticola]|uniref:Aspartate aminotransferase n=1 Tax=Raoultella planticola TaxID=575 RepID=A0A485A5V1_RAOPL|nr:Aspartate aminotransferase [Raoultella planticola]
MPITMRPNHTLDFDGMLASLNEAQAGDVVLFHGCCHNPTGIDPTLEQWQQLAQLSVEKGWLPLFDFAYQGFARGLEEDAEGLRAFVALHKELLVCELLLEELWPVQRTRGCLHAGCGRCRDR